MKVLIDARLYGLENAGIGRYQLNLVKELVKSGKDEYVVLLRDKYYQTLNLPKNWKKVAVSYRHYSLREQAFLTRLIRKESPDLAHFLHFNVPLTYKDPFVVTIHDLLMHKFKGKDSTTLPLLLHHMKKAGYYAVIKHAVGVAEKIIVPSDWVKEDMLSHFDITPDKLVVIYEGVESSITSAKIDKRALSTVGAEQPYFIYTGSAYPHKNLDRAIEAIAYLNEIGIRVNFYIVSARSIFTQRVAEMVAEKNAEKYVKFLGFVPDEDLASLYAYSEAFLYPSYHEGFGLSGLEAMSVGALAVVSDIPVFKEIYKEHAYYFNPYDYSAIARALKDVLTISPQERKKMIASGKMHVKNYSWTKMAKETDKVYHSVCE